MQQKQAKKKLKKWRKILFFAIFHFIGSGQFASSLFCPQYPCKVYPFCHPILKFLFYIKNPCELSSITVSPASSLNLLLQLLLFFWWFSIEVVSDCLQLNLKGSCIITQRVYLIWGDLYFLILKNLNKPKTSISYPTCIFQISTNKRVDRKKNVCGWQKSALHCRKTKTMAGRLRRSTRKWQYDISTRFYYYWRIY